MDVRYQGNSILLNFQAADDLGNVMDLTGATVACSLVQRFVTNPQPVAATTTAVDDGPNGLCHAEFSSAQTSALVPEAYYQYDCSVLLPSTEVFTIGEGEFRLLAPVTPTP